MCCPIRVRGNGACDPVTGSRHFVSMEEDIMNNNQGKDPSAQKPAFATNEGLRQLLLRLSATPGAWRQDPEARALSEYVTERYARLCRKWGRDPGEAAVAAFNEIAPGE